MSQRPAQGDAAASADPGPGWVRVAAVGADRLADVVGHRAAAILRVVGEIAGQPSTRRAAGGENADGPMTGCATSRSVQAYRARRRKACLRRGRRGCSSSTSVTRTSAPRPTCWASAISAASSRRSRRWRTTTAYSRVAAIRALSASDCVRSSREVSIPGPDLPRLTAGTIGLTYCLGPAAQPSSLSASISRCSLRNSRKAASARRRYSSSETSRFSGLSSGFAWSRAPAGCNPRQRLALENPAARSRRAHVTATVARGGPLGRLLAWDWWATVNDRACHQFD